MLKWASFACKVFLEYTALAGLILCCHRLLSMQHGMYDIFSIAEVLSVKVKVKIALSFLMLYFNET